MRITLHSLLPAPSMSRSIVSDNVPMANGLKGFTSCSCLISLVIKVSITLLAALPEVPGHSSTLEVSISIAIGKALSPNKASSSGCTIGGG